MIEDDGKYTWTDEMFEGVVDESQYHPDMSGRYYSDSEPDIVDDYVHRLKDNECQIALPEGYQFVDRQGNILDTPLIMVKKKGVEYPKDYDECCYVLDDGGTLQCFQYEVGGCFFIHIIVVGSVHIEQRSGRRTIVCRST